MLYIDINIDIQDESGKIARCYLSMLLSVTACSLKLLASWAGPANYSVLAGTAGPYRLAWPAQAVHGLARPACQGGHASKLGGHHALDRSKPTDGKRIPETNTHTFAYA